MEQTAIWLSVLSKFLKHFFLEDEDDTAEMYIDQSKVSSTETKSKSGGYCPITGMPYKYDREVPFNEAFENFKRSLTKEESESISVSFNGGEYADAEEHDAKKSWTEITIMRK